MTTNYTGYSKISAVLLLLTDTTLRLIKITKTCRADKPHKEKC